VNLQYVIAEYISRGEKWLERQNESGHYVGLVRYEGDYPPEQKGPGIQATATAAHYWAWSAAMNVGRDRGHLNHAKLAGDALVAYWEANQKHLPSGLDSGFEYFFDLGTAARALYALFTAMRNSEGSEYADVAVQMVARMTRFADPYCGAGSFKAALPIPGAVVMLPANGDARWRNTFDGDAGWRNTFGPHQRRAALALRLFNRPVYDFVDMAAMEQPMVIPEAILQPHADLPLASAYLLEPVEKQTKPKPKVAEELAEAARRAEVKLQESMATYCHLEAYSAEGLVVGQFSQRRAAAAIEYVGMLLGSTPITRTDAFAQWCRLRLLTGGKPAFPLIDIERLCAAQQPSGGWRLYMDHPEEQSASHWLSVEATVIALPQ